MSYSYCCYRYGYYGNTDNLAVQLIGNGASGVL